MRGLPTFLTLSTDLGIFTGFTREDAVSTAVPGTDAGPGKPCAWPPRPRVPRGSAVSAGAEFILFYSRRNWKENSSASLFSCVFQKQVLLSGSGSLCLVGADVSVRVCICVDVCAHAPSAGGVSIASKLLAVGHCTAPEHQAAAAPPRAPVSEQVRPL